jgi:alanine racemase
MRHYRMEDLCRYAGGQLFQHAPGAEIAELLFDSRRVYRPTQSLFIALRSERNDGHRYINKLLKQGVKNFMVSVLPEQASLMAANFILVPDTLKAMQKIASAHRRLFNYPVLGITGSNGKTIVKEWIYELMRRHRHIVRSPKSFNSQIGAPLSVWLLSELHDLAIIEAGISMPGEMDNLWNVIRPDMGLITNLGSAHLENFGNAQAILSEKLRLFKDVSKLYYCRDHEAVHLEIKRQGINTVSWGKTGEADYQILKIEKEEKTTNVSLKGPSFSVDLILPFTDQASVENAMHAVVFSVDQGVPPELVKAYVLNLHPVEMRLELRKGRQQSTIINDAYSADQESLKIAIDYMLQQLQHQKRTVILSDFMETGEAPDQFYRKLSELLNNKHISRLIGIGTDIRTCEQFFRGEMLFFSRTEDLIRQIPALSFNHECILVKGARQFGFERLFAALQEKFHETVLEVNLSAMVANLNFYRSLIPAGIKTMAMVKAFSYGSGSAEVASTLQSNGVDYLAVAYADEGIDLRKSGITLPVMVMNPELDSLQELINYGLEPEVYSFRMLHQLSEIVRASNGYEGYPVKIHLKLDTGMHRLGFTGDEIPQLISTLEKTELIEVVSVFSHLAASENPAHDDFTRLQIERFTKWTHQLEAHFGKSFLRHILNSAGISRHPDGIFDMIRLGIGLYGIGSAAEQEKLSHVSSLKTTISQIRELQAGETIGYGRLGKVTSDQRIATIAIGYADGFPRKLGAGNGSVYIHGQKAPTIGNVCMDLCMVDVTNIREAREGDTAIVFNTPEHIRAFSAKLDTIPYEVLTGISARVKRIYFQE